MENKVTQDKLDFVSKIRGNYDYPKTALYLRFFPQDINPYAEHLLEFIEDNLEGERILDAGCGAGWLSYCLANEGKNVASVDIDEDQLGMFREFFEHFGVEYELYDQDVKDLDFSEEEFDSAVSIGLTGIVEPEEFLSEIKRVVKPQAPIIVTVSNDRKDKSLEEWELKFNSIGLEIESYMGIGSKKDKYLVKLAKALRLGPQNAKIFLDIRQKIFSGSKSDYVVCLRPSGQ